MPTCMQQCKSSRGKSWLQSERGLDLHVAIAHSKKKRRVILIKKRVSCCTPDTGLPLMASILSPIWLISNRITPKVKIKTIYWRMLVCLQEHSFPFLLCRVETLSVFLCLSRSPYFSLRRICLLLQSMVSVCHTPAITRWQFPSKFFLSMV